MNEYISLSNQDNLIKDRTYLGYEQNNCAILTHVIGGNRVIQLSETIRTIANNVELVGTDRNLNMLNTNAKPYPRKRDHLYNINR